MHVHHAVTEVSQLISESKDKYYSKLSMKLNNPKTSSKTYWFIQCTPLVNNSKLPDKITYNSAARLTSIKFGNNDVLKIIRSLNINKAHGHDISVRMIKCVMNHWFSHCHLYSGLVLILAFIQILGRNLI